MNYFDENASKDFQQTINKSDDSLLDFAITDLSVSECLGCRFLSHIRIIKVLSSTRLFELYHKKDNKAIEIILKVICS